MNDTIAGLSEIDVPLSWQHVLDHLRAQPGTMMILGAMDTGKSTLAQVMIHMFQRDGRHVMWVDCDVGQSDIGPPTTIAMKAVEPSTDLGKELQPEAMRFAGSTSPRGHLLPMVVGMHRVVQLARQWNAEAIVVNTTGMVYGGVARALNMHLVDVIRPDYILALQGYSEIEHLLRPVEQLGQCSIHRLSVSKKVRPRSRETRRQIRQDRFRTYFQLAQECIFSFSQLSLQNIFLNSGSKLSEKQRADATSTLDTKIVYGEQCSDGVSIVAQGQIRDYNLSILKEMLDVEHISILPVADFENRLVGLCNADNDLLALGLLQQIDWSGELLTIHTPISEASLGKVKVMQFGSLKVDRAGMEYPLGRNA